ncbi:MAG: nucleoside transporter [Spartobacteria bacterium]|nr:nucleoside transporter [Spartobacteria bacterium]
MLLAWGLSAQRRAVRLRTVLGGVAIQLVFGVLVFVVPWVSRGFLLLSDLVVKVLDAAKAGNAFCFGPLAAGPGAEGSIGFILVFQGLTLIVFFAALMELLYNVGVMPFILKCFSRLFSRMMDTSGAESLCVSSNIFVGIEAATTIRPYIERMTASELCTILTAGMATIASSMLAFYVFTLRATFPNIAAHLMSASLLSAPAAIVMSKLLFPEQGQPETLGLHVDPHYDKDRNFLEAMLYGANSGGRLVLGVVVMLLALLGMVELVNIALGVISTGLANIFGIQYELTLQGILSYVFYPFTLLIGVPPADAFTVAGLLGERAVLTEIPAYQHLNELLAAGAFHHPRSPVIASYALCGFTHVASIAIFVGGISALAPSQTKNLTRVAFRAFLAATLACLMTAAVAGMFYGRACILFQ